LDLKLLNIKMLGMQDRMVPTGENGTQKLNLLS
jgi:hypothetical protein